MDKVIDYYEIVLGIHHKDIVGRVRYAVDSVAYESNLYSIPELNNLLTLWRMGELCGSFGIGHKLAKDAAFQIMES
jgi:hypothetical protein